MSTPETDGETEAIEAVVGSPDSDDGRTSVRVARSGRFVVVHESRRDVSDESSDQTEDRGDEAERSEGDVRDILGTGPEPLLEVADALDWRDRFPERPGLPDEPILELRQDAAGSGPRVVRFWLRDAEEDPQLERLLNPLRLIAERATDGRRYL